MRRLRLSTGAINAVALAISSALNFLAFALWTYLLSPEQLGLFTLISLTTLMLNAIIFEWLRLSMARLLYDAADPLEISPGKANAISAVALSLALVLFLMALFLSLFSIRIAGVDPVWAFAVVAWLISEMAFTLSTTLNRLRLKSWRFFANMVVRAVLSLSCGYALVAWAGFGAAGVVIGIIGAQLLCAGASILSDPVMRRLRPARLDRGELRTLFAFGGPLMLSAGLTYAATSADRLILGATLGTAEVGQYSVAVDFMQKTILFGMLAINLTAYPAIVRAFERNGPDAGRRALERNFLIQLGIGLPMTIGVAVLAPGIADIVIGPAFRDSVVALLPVVGLAALLRGLATFHLSVALQVFRATRLIVIAPAISLAVIALLGYLGVHLGGLRGMALAVMAASALSFATLAEMVRRVAGIGLLSAGALKIGAAAAVMGLVLWPFRLHTAPAWTVGLVCLGAGTYGVLVLILRPLGRSA